ncbi:TonB-dependent receptor [Litorimonas sp.]|uniref:TonB-dependent receptor n=1 Tax=Litorimonas sp. TaxID=1892381 RepID=UPI003A8975B9
MKNTLSSLGFNAVMSASAFALTMGLAATASAQVTTSQVQGYVTTENASPISNASVTLSNAATGIVRTVTTDSSGSFSFRNLPVGGLYNVAITADGFQGERVEDVALTLGDTTALNFTLQGGSVTDEIIVVAQRQVLADVAVGPSASFGQATLENAPVINRNFTDVIRIDPRIYIDESRGDINAIQCGGQNPRFNSITLDGVALNDSFGLNSNGFPTERIPFSFDAIEQVSVELAPFDVEYGGFTACAINSVTKSGTNEFHGGAFIDYTDDGLRASKLEGEDIDFGEFDEIRYGVNVGGPIIKDRLFFFGAYEKLEGANIFTNNNIGTGSFQVSQAQLDRISQISNDIYQYDPGTIINSAPNEDEKFLGKLSLNINNKHRAEAIYAYNNGFNIVRSDGDSDELEFSNHLYSRGSELNSITGAVYSDWTQNLSTELRVGYLELENDVRSLGGNDFGEIRIDTGDVNVYIGGDDSRQANKLTYDVWNFVFKGNYAMGNHNISFGAERSDLDVFNLFIQQAETEIRFNSIDDFENGFAAQIEYNNAPSHNPEDAAAVWGYATNTVYAQDEYDFGNGLTLIGGLRYDFYTTDDAPEENADFVADYGFSNSTNLDGEGLVQPRFGLTWEASNNLTVRGGVGLYSGGNPNVWLSNNFSANNVLQFGARERNFDLFSSTYEDAEEGVPNSAGYAIPTSLFNDVSSGTGRNFEINYLDPDFKIPSEWKYALGFTYNPDFNTGENLFGGEWLFNADIQFSKSQNTAIVQRADLVQTGTETRTFTLSDGRTVTGEFPTFDSPLEDAFVLTNSDVGNESLNISFSAAKDWNNGHRATFGYSYSDAKDVQPMTSSVAFSNYNNRAFTNPQEQVLSTSNYNIRHRFTATYAYEKAFFGDYLSKLFLYSQFNEGRPFSRVLDNGGGFFGFTPFIADANVLIPGTERNEFTSPWWFKADLKLEQEIPGIKDGHNASVFMTIDNLTNLIDSDWGILEEGSFPRTLVTGQGVNRVNDASAYEIRFGASYDF